MQLIVSTTSSSEKNNLALYKRRKDGSVELINEFDAGTKPSYHFFDENRSLLFVVNEMNFDMHSRSGTIRSYRIDRSNGKETLLNEVDSRGEDPCFLTMDPDRRFLLCANYIGSGISLFRIREDGSLSEAIQVFTWKGSGPVLERQDKSHPHSITFTPDGKYILVPDLGCDLIRVLQWADGVLTVCEKMNIKMKPASGPRMVLFVPESNDAWAVNELDCSAVKLRYSSDQMEIIEIVSLLDDVGKKIENTSAHIFCTKEYVCFSNRGLDNIVVLNPGKKSYPGRGRCPRFFTLDDEKGLLFIAWQDSHRIDEYDISDKGEINFSRELINIANPACVTVL